MDDVVQKKCVYLITLQFLGFRFSGWAKNKNVKTVHQMIDKTLECVLGNHWFRTLGCSRTDAMVSANIYLMQLISLHQIQTAPFLELFNMNLPPDIRVLSIRESAGNFNIIKSVKEKEYIYLFAFGKKFHPFGASLMAYFPDVLDISLMKRGAKLFEGKHDFINYCSTPGENIKSIRLVTCSEIVENREFTASFFPEESYFYRVKSQGFMRNQIRLMVGQLVELGRGVLSLDELARSLAKRNQVSFRKIAPASGLILNTIDIPENSSSASALE